MGGPGGRPASVECVGPVAGTFRGILFGERGCGGYGCPIVPGSLGVSDQPGVTGFSRCGDQLFSGCVGRLAVVGRLSVLGVRCCAHLTSMSGLWVPRLKQ